MIDNRPSRKLAFTLIELLIVVAIIAILAAIAVPNFMEAQVRAKVSRAKADMRTMATALEAYAVDWNRVPLSGTEWRWDNGGPAVPGGPFSVGGDQALNALTTPVAFINRVLTDPFVTEVGVINKSTGTPAYTRRTFIYLSCYVNAVARQNNQGYRDAFAAGYHWSVHSFGPTRNSAGNTNVRNILVGETQTNPNVTDSVYDSSNGTVSSGFIIRTNKGDFSGTPGS